MGRAKKRQYKLYSAYRKQYGDGDLSKLYRMAKDKDQREQAAKQAERWRQEWDRRYPPGPETERQDVKGENAKQAWTVFALAMLPVAILIIVALIERASQ